MASLDEKKIKALFKEYSKIRITILEGDRRERSQIKKFLRDDGFGDIVEYDSTEVAWERLQLSTTNVLVFSVTGQDGLDFLDKLIDSTRFKKTPLVIFTSKLEQHKKMYEGRECVAEWVISPINSLKVEKALAKVLMGGVVERSQVTDESMALDLFTRAVERMEEENYEEAKELLRKSLKENPDFFEGYLKMAETLMSLEDHEPAERVLARAESMKPDDPGTLLLKAELAADTKQKEEALKVMEDCVAKRPGDLMFIIGIGNIALDKGWVDEAVRYFEMAKSVDPNLIHVYNRLGIAYSRKGMYDSALSMYELALNIDEADAGVHFNIGMTHFRKGEKKKALASFRQSTALDPELAEPLEMINRIETQEQ